MVIHKCTAFINKLKRIWPTNRVKILFIILIFLSSLYIIGHFRYIVMSKQGEIEEDPFTQASNLMSKYTKLPNPNWQKWTTSNITNFYLYRAFLDNRTSVTNAPVIRVLLMKNNYKETALNYFCHIIFDDNVSITKPVSKLEQLSYMYRDFPGLQGFLLTCELGVKYKDKHPKSVSISESITENEQAQNRLKIEYNLKNPATAKENFALCLKGLRFPDNDISSYLVEWFELLFLMGVNKIFVYVFEVHPNIYKVLRYYEGRNQIEIIPFSYPNHVYINKVQGEKIHYTDCFYKNMNFYKYIAIFDYDEIIIPKHDYTWLDMMNRLLTTLPNETSYSDYRFRRYMSMKNMQVEIPKLPTTKDDVKLLYETRSTLDKGVKSIVDTETVSGLSNHFPTICTSDVCHPYDVDLSIGFAVHYRNTCLRGRDDLCSNKTIIRDIPIHRYSDRLMENVMRTLNSIPNYELSLEKV
ncbi:unnamed protein product [Meganyctiphanes norvegica]|uniref:Glycosyltransferase family 92 protein n=1 Tax=Meganyctiphanes norvegica TaxID=48144 RepID=A0AAV2S6Q2_MEGNR